MDDLGIFRPVPFDYFWEHPDHRWEAEKLDMDLNDIFTTLPKQFNLMAIPILDRDAFRLEASHVASLSNDRTDFFALLATRMDERRKELIDMMMRTFDDLACYPRLTEDTNTWGHILHIYRSKSLDAFVRYFAGLLCKPKPSSGAAVSAHSNHNSRWSPPTNTRTSPAPSRAKTPSPAPDQVPPRRPSSVSTTTTADPLDSFTAVPRARKRPVASEPSSLADYDQGEMRPSKKHRLGEDTVERKRTSSPPSCPAPVFPRPGQALKSKPSASDIRPGSSTVPVAAAFSPAPSTLLEVVEPAADGTNTRKNTERDTVSTATGSKSRRIPRSTKRMATAPPGRGAVGRSRSSPRLTRRTGQRDQAFCELGSNGRAHWLVAKKQSRIGSRS